mgnify:CR=1 FL=1
MIQIVKLTVGMCGFGSTYVSMQGAFDIGRAQELFICFIAGLLVGGVVIWLFYQLPEWLGLRSATSHKLSAFSGDK